MLTIVDVQLSQDLSYADIYVSAIAGVEDGIKYLASQKGSMRAELAASLRLHRIPILRFHRDDVGERGARIDRLLSSL